MISKEDFKVTPWEVKGNIDYEKLIREFGIKPMMKLSKEFEDCILFRRGIVFAQRDFERILDCIKNKKSYAMMTGLMPTGKFHVGHMILAQQMVFYQNLGAKVYIAVADLEAYNARGQSLEASKEIAKKEYLTNYIALGLDLKKADVKRIEAVFPDYETVGISAKDGTNIEEFYESLFRLVKKI